MEETPDEGMRNPGLHLVGIAASPGGGGVFGTMAEEELRQWLDTRLDELGIDPVAYSRFILSFLRHPDSALTPPGEVVTGKGKGRRSRARPKSRLLPLQEDKEKKRAVVQCLTSAADQVHFFFNFIFLYIYNKKFYNFRNVELKP